MAMNESLLHYIWKFRLYSSGRLSLSDGRLLEVENPGQHNQDQGPDFLNARIKIEDISWAGNVEVHVASSDWEKHKHTNDPAYDRIILHVVFKEDKKLFFANGQAIPTLVLEKITDPSLLSRFEILQNPKLKIPCQDQLTEIPKLLFKSWSDRMAIERLEEKTNRIQELLSKNQNNWEETFYQLLFRNFGFHVNTDAFESLARAVPFSILKKNLHSLSQTEALLFGQAGLLSENKNPDEYTSSLQKEYAFLQSKYSLKPIDASLWKFMRTRPSNFPTVRISQLAALITQPGFQFSKIIQLRKTVEVLKLLNVSSSDYWKDHFHFGKKTDAKKGTLGEESRRLLLINTIVPFIFSYLRSKGNEEAENIALDLLNECKAEKNSILRLWESNGIPVCSALESQSLIYLYHHYCSKRRCLECGFGLEILRK
ncbi:MAG: DUF2851 family protein [Bacteroidota bacterium]